MRKDFEEAVFLRKKGYSYTDIQKKLNISKGTLSIWLRDIPYKANESVLGKIAKAREKSKQVKRFLKESSFKNAKDFARSNIDKFSNRDLMIFGLGLYAGEGSKTVITRIVNSDPKIIRLAVRWLNECYSVPKENMFLRLHLYPDHEYLDCYRFWQKVTKFKENQF